MLLEVVADEPRGARAPAPSQHNYGAAARRPIFDPGSWAAPARASGAGFRGFGDVKLGRCQGKATRHRRLDLVAV